MKRDNFTLPLALRDELIIDNFAGGGGTSTGLEQAFGRPVDIAINHNAEALAMHRANHPHTKHYCESVWDVDPRAVTGNQPVGLVWLSPDCKHFSKAKGGKPVEKKIRGLAWVALRWAATTRPRVIMLENVEEFTTWGPLGQDGRPCPQRKGEEFGKFIRALNRQGYAVDYRELRACDYGAPTIRKRFFLIARRDGLPIRWPTPTHGDPKSREVQAGKLLPWRTAAECIDWSIPAPSIFERERPLADATCRRIAKGIMRYVVNAAEPFIVNTRNGEREGQQPRVRSIHEPAWTITAQGSQGALVAPVLTEFANASSPRCMPADEPLRTICAQTKGGHHALVSAFLAKHYTGVVGSSLEESIGTVTSVDHHSLVAANLVHMGHGEGKDGSKRFSHGIRDLEQPINTITASGATAGLVTSNMIKLRGDNVGAGTNEPLHTISAGGTHHAEVRAFMVKYYGNDKDGVEIKGPLHTIPTHDRFGLVTVAGEQYAITDIGLRMLAPRELFTAQGFPSSYIIEHGIDERGQQIPLTKTAQVRMCGNSVCPPLSRAIVEANFAHELAWRQPERTTA
jgi:DNA (cytosine-5)-methyltransferase 1